ncbi:MAG: YtrH family sporulation protein [Candidatus Syntrophopropionicum ammoniitolerans]
MTFGKNLILIFFTAMGVLLGAALVGIPGRLDSTRNPPRYHAQVGAGNENMGCGGSYWRAFSTIEILESGILRGEITAVLKQLFFIFSAMAEAI